MTQAEKLSEPHSRVFEHDGAYECLDCKATWGALPGSPTMPGTCEKPPCPTCYGTGEDATFENLPMQFITPGIPRCPDCHGTGRRQVPKDGK